MRWVPAENAADHTTRKVYIMNESSDTRTMSITDVPVYPDVPTYANVLGSLHVWRVTAGSRSRCPGRRALRRVQPDRVDGGDLQWPGRAGVPLEAEHQRRPHLADRHVEASGHARRTRLGRQPRPDDPGRRGLVPPVRLIRGRRSRPRMGLDVEIVRNIFLFQIAGPTSIQVIERLLGESRAPRLPLRADIPIAGTDVFELSRIGMAGTLAYEMRGPTRTAPPSTTPSSRRARTSASSASGWRTYLVNHAEGGFPQMNARSCRRSPIPGPQLAPCLRGQRSPRPTRRWRRSPGSVDPDRRTRAAAHAA